MMDAFIGMIGTFGFNFAPRGWAFCNGQVMPISEHAQVFSLISSTYGGDGRSTFGLPNLNGRVAVGQGQAAGGNVHWAIGSAYGSESHYLTAAELAPHSHPATFVPQTASAALQASTQTGDSATPTAGAYLAQTAPPGGGVDRPEQIYRSELGDNPVNLGGITFSGDSGAVSVGVTGAGHPFDLIQPSLALNYSMVMEGVYPSRS